MPPLSRCGPNRRDALPYLRWGRPRGAEANAAGDRPPGIDEGHQIRLSGEGEAGPREGPAGHLYVVVHVENHAQLKRQGAELFYELPISIVQASLGTRVVVPTADGEETVEVKPGTQPGSEIRLRGRGAPHLRRTGARGDLHVLVDVRVPSRLSRRQRELLEEFAAEAGEPLDGTQPAARGAGREKGPGFFDKVKDAIS